MEQRQPRRAGARLLPQLVSASVPSTHALSSGGQPAARGARRQGAPTRGPPLGSHAGRPGSRGFGLRAQTGALEAGVAFPGSSPGCARDVRPRGSRRRPRALSVARSVAGGRRRSCGPRAAAGCRARRGRRAGPTRALPRGFAWAQFIVGAGVVATGRTQTSPGAVRLLGRRRAPPTPPKFRAEGKQRCGPQGTVSQPLTPAREGGVRTRLWRVAPPPPGQLFPGGTGKGPHPTVSGWRVCGGHQGPGRCWAWGRQGKRSPARATARDSASREGI